MNQPLQALVPPVPATEDGAIAAPGDLLGAGGPVSEVAGGPAPSIPAADREAPIATTSELDRALEAEALRVVALIRDRLPGFPPVDEADVSAVLLLLDSHNLTLAASIMRMVGRDHRGRLYRRINAGHRRRHRRSVLAALLAADLEQRREFPPTFLNGMPFDDLAPIERAAIVWTLRGLTDATFTALLTENPAVREIMSTPADEAILGRERTIELEAARSRATARSTEDNELVGAVNALFASRRGNWRSEILRLLMPLLPPAAEPGQSPTEVPRSARLAAVVERIESGDRVRDLIDDLASGWNAHTLGQTAGELIRHRSPAANLAHVQRLLTRSISDWMVRDWEAWLAYQIVRRLPPADQLRWRELDGGRWFRRMLDELPEDLRRSEYEGVTVEMVDGQLRDVASRRAAALRTVQGQRDFRALVATCAEGVTEANAPGLLLRIMGVAQDTGPDGLLLMEGRREEVQRAVAQGLDNLGYLAQIFQRLPDRWLFQMDNHTLFRRVAAMRDPGMILRQINDLVSRNGWRDVPILGIFASDWSTSAHDAFIAFLLARHLPESDRRELSATGQWGALTGALTQDMRHAVGTHLFADPGEAETARIRDRLGAEWLWRAEHAAELRTLVRMAIELGEHRRVFELSRDRRAWEIPELRPMVDRFRLYAEPGRVNYEPYALREEEPAQDLWTVLRRAGSWLWVNARALGRALGALRLNLAQVGFDGLDLNDVQQLMGGGIGPAQLRTSAANELTAIWEPRDGTLILNIPRLSLDRVNHLGSGFTARTNSVEMRELTIAASFPAQATGRPTALRMRMSSLDVEDLLLTATSGIVGAARATMTGLGIDAGPTGDETPAPAPPGSDFTLPIPIIGPIIAWLVNAIQRIGYASRSLRGLGTLQAFSATASTINFEGLAIGGDWTAASLSFTDVMAGAGLNRRAFLLQLITVLERRLARATDRGDTDAVARHSARLTETRERLRRLMDPSTHEGSQWARLQYLRERFVTEGRLHENLRREAALLEQELTGGAVADIGSMSLSGLSGSVYVDDVVLTGLTGDVESPVFGPDTAPASSQFVTDADRVAAFRERGPGHPGGAIAPAALPLRAETAEVRGVSRLAETVDLPTVAALERQLAALPPGTPEERRRLLESIIEDAGEYEAARAALSTPGLRPRDPEALRLVQLRLELARLRLRSRFGINIESISATDAGADMIFGPGLTDLEAIRFGAGTFRVRNFGMGAYHVDEIAGVGIGATPETDLAPGPDGRPRRGYRLDARSLSASGVTLDWAGNRLAGVSVTGLSGEFEMLRPSPGADVTGYRVTALRAASVVIDGIDYRTASMWVHSEGPTTLTGVEINATMERAGEGWIARVPRVRVARVSADNLIAENNGGTDPWRATVRSGALLGLEVDDLIYSLPAMGDPQLVSGHFGLGGLDRLRFNVTAGAFSFAGTLGSRRPVGTLRVRAAQGRQSFDLSGLVLTEGLLGTGDGQVAIERLVLNAGATHVGDTWQIRYLQIPILRLGRLHWRAGEGASISSDGGVTLRNLEATGSVRTPANGPMRVRVDDLRIASITATSLHYQSPPIYIDLGRATTATPDEPPLRIETITLSGFEWSQAGGITSGTFGIAGVTADFSGTLARHLTTEATLNVTNLSATFSAGGHIVMRAGASLDADVHYHDPGSMVWPGRGRRRRATTGRPRQDADAHISVENFDTGDVAIGPDSIEIGAGTGAPLSIGSIAVNAINYRSRDLRVESMAGGRGAVLHDLRARVRLNLRRPGTAGDGPISSIVLREVSAEGLELDGVRLTLPNVVAPGGAHPVTIWIAPGEAGWLRGFSLNIPPPLDGLEITAPSGPRTTWSIPDLGLLISGDTDPAGVRRPALLLPRLRTAIAGRMEASATVNVDRIGATRFSGGNIVLDLTSPSITSIVAAFGGATPSRFLNIEGLPTGTLPEGGISAGHIRYDHDAGEITATDLSVSQLTYRDGPLLVRLDRARLPGDVRTLLADTRRRRGTSVTIPSLVLDGAYIEYEQTPGTPAAGTSSRPYADLLSTLFHHNVDTVLNNLSGQLNFDLVVRAVADNAFYAWLAGSSIPMRLGFTDGRLSLADITAGLHTSLAGSRLYFDFDGSTLRLRADIPDLPVGPPGMIPYPLPSPSIPIPDYTIVSWTLSTGELTTAQARGEVPVWRMMNFTGYGRDKLEDILNDPPAPGPPGVELTNIDGRLSITNTAPIPILLPASATSLVDGRITLAANAVVGLELHGNIPRSAGTSATTAGSGLEPVSLEQARVDSVNLNFTGLGTLRTGRIRVSDISNVIFRLSRGDTAAGTYSNGFERFSGNIRNATAENITWSMP